MRKLFPFDFFDDIKSKPHIAPKAVYQVLENTPHSILYDYKNIHASTVNYDNLDYFVEEYLIKAR